MSERRQQAWDEAQRRYPASDRQAGFVAGAAWADDNPQPRTITREQFLEALDAHVGLGASGDWVTVEDMLVVALGALGIEVEDGDE